MLWVKLSWVELWVPQSLSANFCPIRQGCRRRSYNSVLQNFVAFIPSLSIRQIMANFSRIEFQSTSGKEKKIIVLCSRPPQNAVKTGLHAGVQWPQRILLSCRFNNNNNNNNNNNSLYFHTRQKIHILCYNICGKVYIFKLFTIKKKKNTLT